MLAIASFRGKTGIKFRFGINTNTVGAVVQNIPNNSSNKGGQTKDFPSAIQKTAASDKQNLAQQSLKAIAPISSKNKLAGLAKKCSITTLVGLTALELFSCRPKHSATLSYCESSTEDAAPALSSLCPPAISDSSNILSAATIKAEMEFHGYTEASISNVVFDSEALRNIAKQHRLKYGTPKKPKLFIKKDYKWPNLPETSSVCPRVEKNDEFRALLTDLVQVVTDARAMLLKCEKERSHQGGLTPQLEKLLEEDPVFKEIAQARCFETYLNTEKENRSSLELLSALTSLARFEFLNRKGKICILDQIKVDKARAQIANQEPDLLRENRNTPELRSMLSPYLVKILSGYPENFPQIEVLSSAQQLNVRMGLHYSQGVQLCALHSWKDDCISTYPQSRLDTLLYMAHECGHALFLLKESQPLTLSEQQFIGELKQLKTQVAELSKDLEQVTPSEHWKRNPELTSRYNSLRKHVLSIDSLQTIVILEETAARIFQEILMRDFAKERPQIAQALLQVNAYACELMQNEEHFLGFRLAEKLIKDHQGNALAAWKEISNLDPATDQERLNDYAQQIAKIRSEEPRFLQNSFNERMALAQIYLQEEGLSLATTVAWANNNYITASSAKESLAEYDKLASRLLRKYLAKLGEAISKEKEQNKQMEN